MAVTSTFLGGTQAEPAQLFYDFCLGIRSERRLCEEAHLNLAYRWFCRLGLGAMDRRT